MRANYKLLVPLVCSLIGLSVGFAWYQSSAEKHRLEQELDRRGATLAVGLVDAVEPALARGAVPELRRIAQRFAHDDRVQGIAIADAIGTPLATTPRVAPITQAEDVFRLAQDHRQGIGTLVRFGSASWHVFALPLYRDEGFLGVLAVVHDASEIDAQGARVMRELLMQGTAQALLLVAALLVLRSSLADQIQNATAWIRSVKTGKKVPSLLPVLGGVFQPLAAEVRDLALSLDAARASAEQEARLRDASESRWTAERLRVNSREVNRIQCSCYSHPSQRAQHPPGAYRGTADFVPTDQLTGFEGLRRN